MHHELGTVLVEDLRRDVEREVDPEQEIHLQPVHLANQYAAHLRVVGVVVVGVVEELGGQQDRRNDDPVHVQVRQ